MTAKLIIYAISFAFVGLFVYLMKRWGPVYHSWVKVTKEELATLKEANRAAMATGHTKAKPQGKPLYKRGLVSHKGLAVFGNGLYAKFCLGPKGRYQLVPFEELSGIYPMRVESPLKKGQAWKALQFETHRGLTMMVDSRSHNFEVLVSVLKQAMGPRWQELYRPEEELWSNILEGEALRHRLIRGEPEARASSEPQGKDELSAPVEPKRDKGALLLLESPEDMKRRRANFGKGAALLLGCGTPLALVPIVVWQLQLEMPRLIAVWVYGFLGLMAFILIAFGLVLLVASSRLQPIKIYENGFEFTNLAGNRVMFISLGEVKQVTEKKNFIDGEVVVFDTGNPYQVVALCKGMGGLDRILEELKAKAGKAEYLVELPQTDEGLHDSRRLEYTLYGVSFLVGVIISLFITYWVFADEGWIVASTGFLQGLAIILPPLTMFTVTYMTYRMPKMERVFEGPLNIKVPVVIVLLLAVIFYGNLALDSADESGPLGTELHIEPRPEASSLEPASYRGAYLTVEGDILVAAGETLRLVNSTLIFNLSRDGGGGIQVVQGGTLIMANSTIKSNNTSLGYTFEIMGAATLNNSTIENLWGNKTRVNLEGGLEIYSDEVVIRGSRIIGGATNALLIVDSNPTIEGNLIEGARDDGIELVNSRAIIKNNTIRGCRWAMVIARDSAPLIEGNQFIDNDHGVAVESSNPTLKGNRFEANRAYAVSYDADSHPILSGNLFVDNEVDVAEERGSNDVGLCAVVVSVETIICLAVLIRLRTGNRPKKQKSL